jgi:hypothetical protein
MLNTSCSYNCSEYPNEISPYTDITGIGVCTLYLEDIFMRALIELYIGCDRIHGVGRHCRFNNHTLLPNFL